MRLRAHRRSPLGRGIRRGMRRFDAGLDLMTILRRSPRDAERLSEALAESRAGRGEAHPHPPAGRIIHGPH